MVGWLTRLNRTIMYVVFGLLATGCLVFTVAATIDLQQPRIEGTFVHERCEVTPKNPCRSIGTWTSDEGRIVKREIYLDGSPGPDGSTTAVYQPTGILNDESNNIVHVPQFAYAGPIVGAGLVLFCVGYPLYRARGWGDLPIRRRLARDRG